MLCPFATTEKPSAHARRSAADLRGLLRHQTAGRDRLPVRLRISVSARIHPPAVVQRQQELDRAMLLPLLQGLSERQARLFLMLGRGGDAHHGERCRNSSTTTSRRPPARWRQRSKPRRSGIVYEHQPPRWPASRLMAELKAMVDEVVKNAGSALERDAAIALRRIEQAAKMMAAVATRRRSGRVPTNCSGCSLRVLAPPPCGREEEPRSARTCPASSAADHSRERL